MSAKNYGSTQMVVPVCRRKHPAETLPLYIEKVFGSGRIAGYSNSDLVVLKPPPAFLVFQLRHWSNRKPHVT
jgi:hypothetical protein